MKKFFYNWLYNYFSVNNLLSSFRFGFRSGASTEYALLKFSDDILKLFDQKKIVWKSEKGTHFSVSFFTSRKIKLTIYEALAILHRKPDLNKQIDHFVNPLKLFFRSTHITKIITDLIQNMNIINSNYTNLATLATPQPSTSLIPHRYPTRNRSSNN